MRSTLIRCAAAMCLLLSAACLQAQATKPAADKPADEPAAAQKPAVISAGAKAVLDDLRSAYANLKSLDLAGKVSLDLDAAGEKHNETGEFTASFQAPGKFRHEMKNDLLIVSNGDKAFVYKADQKKYITVDAIKERAEFSDIPDPIGPELEQQNPSLLLAIVKDAAAELAADVDTVDRDADVVLDGTSYQSLTLKSGGQVTNVLVHPKTHLVRQVKVDLKDRLVQRGVPQVNTAAFLIEYTKSESDSAPAAGAETAFDWTPPADAMMVKLAADAAPGAAEENHEPSMALVGKPSPAFELKDLSGQSVTLASQKGQVVVLDFWATWCGPCVEGLPHLDALHKELAAKGMKAFAIDLRETKAQAQKFVTDHKLGLTVLLDTDGSVGESYKVTGIPQTVVVGKDGNVKKVFIGYGPGSEDKLREAVEAALKE